MTIKEIRNKLYGYKKAKNKLIRTRRELEEVEALLTSISLDYSNPRVKSSPTPDKLSNHMDKLIQIATRIKQDHEDAINEMVEVEDLIRLVYIEDFQRVLVLRYINCLYWEDVAKEMNYSIPRVKQMESRGCQIIKKRIIHNYT